MEEFLQIIDLTDAEISFPKKFKTKEVKINGEITEENMEELRDKMEEFLEESRDIAVMRMTDRPPEKD